MGLVLFDWKFYGVAKYGVISSFSDYCLFDGYLTEPTSYPQLSQLAYLTETCFTLLKASLTISFSDISLFDAYLTEYKK